MSPNAVPRTLEHTFENYWFGDGGWDMSELSGPAGALTGFVDAAHAGWVAENQAAAQRFVACHALFNQCLARWESQEQSCAGARPGHAVVDPFTVATGYVVAAMAISSVRAETMLSFAWDLHERYPAILTALSAGRLDQAAAERLARQMGAVDDQVLARVQQQVVDDYLATIEAGERPGAQAIRDRVDEIIAAHDPALRPGTVWRSRMEKVPGEIQGSIVSGEPNAFTLLADILPLSPAEHSALEAVHGPLPPQARYILQPETGRTHQLRLHMWAAGVPILGDNIYPRIHTEEEEDMTRPLHLVSTGLAFTDPLSGERREFTVPRRLFHGGL